MAAKYSEILRLRTAGTLPPRPRSLTLWFSRRVDIMVVYTAVKAKEKVIPNGTTLPPNLKCRSSRTPALLYPAFE